MTNTDTIAAIATPAGSGGIGIVRISGPQTFDIAGRLFVADGKIGDFVSHRAHHGRIVSTETGATLDDVVLTSFRAPRSYTGEDVVEISCHGGYAVLRSVLTAVMDAGTRLAEPGEFTRRAFLNGKMDLAQAEAVNDLIRARTDGSRRAALTQLQGGLSDKVGAINTQLLGLLALIEAAIDFPDDIPEPETDFVESSLRKSREILAELASSFDKGCIYRDGIRVVLAGQVNVGKSSLLNALLRHARAIVTPIPGTTRDVIEESLEIRGIPVVAIDTAGLRATDDPVEKIGVELTRKSLETADVVLYIFDASGQVDEVYLPVNKPIIVVLNKIDLVSGQRREELRRCFGDAVMVETSAETGQGIDVLEEKIAELAGAGYEAESSLVTNLRHRRLLESALESLDNALTTARSGIPVDMVSVDIAAARRRLGEITGETATDDLLDRIFSEFCIGK